MNSQQSTSSIDPFEVLSLFKYPRVADVSDAMDSIGYFGIGLMSSAIRPLWEGIKFWGVALTLRCVPAHMPMPRLETREESVDPYSVWRELVGAVNLMDDIRPGHVIVTDTGGAREAGKWGSANSLGHVLKGAVGIVTDGYVRDTDECILEKLPICARARTSCLLQSRLELVESQVRIGCGGVQVRPNDIVGCDGDGVIVVPLEVAEEVGMRASLILLRDMRGRRRLYERGDLPPDPTVDYEAVETYYSQFG